MPNVQSTRRTFLQQSGVLAGTTLASAISRRAYAAEDNTIKIALVGCGGRGSGAAAQALSTKGPTKLVAMADAFANRLNSSRQSLSKQVAEKLDVPAERQFIGLDAYRKAIDAVAPGGVVILATPLRSGRSIWSTPSPRAAMSSWRSCSPSMRRVFAECSGPARRRARRTSRSPAA